jgi:hypothetical protein
MHYTAWVRLVVAAILSIAGSGRVHAQDTEIPARNLSPGAVTTLCAELETWFADEAAAFTSSVRTGGADAMRRYYENFLSDSSALVVKGSGNFIFYSRAALVDSIAASPADLAPDRFYESRPVATSVALLSSTRAMYFQRALEIDSATVARGLTRIFSWAEAGTVVRTQAGWRKLERVNTTGSLGAVDSATARVRPWQCR